MNSKFHFHRIFFCIAMMVGTYANLQAANTPPPPEPKALPRTTRAIKVDGDLSDDGWKGALIDDRFYETSPGNNTPAKVKTTVFLTYDEHYFYIGIKADDPQPSKIRAPFVERDQVLGTDDNIAVFLDTRNDKKTAMELGAIDFIEKGIDLDQLVEKIKTVLK